MHTKTTPLMLACQSENLEEVKILLRSYCNPLDRDQGGRTAFHYIPLNTHIMRMYGEPSFGPTGFEIYNLMRDHVKKRLSDALFTHIENLDSDAVEKLLKNPWIDLSLKNLAGQTPLEVVYGLAESDTTKIIKEMITEKSSLFLRAKTTLFSRSTPFYYDRLPPPGGEIEMQTMAEIAASKTRASPAPSLSPQLREAK